MSKIKVGDRVKYTGVPNRWTYNKDIESNCNGEVIAVIESRDEIKFQIKFDNGILTSIDCEDLELINKI